MTKKICVFCGHDIPDDSFFCARYNEYTGYKYPSDAEDDCGGYGEERGDDWEKARVCEDCHKKYLGM